MSRIIPPPPRRHAHRKAASHERWIISYADLLTLLLALFVVLFAASHHDTHKMDVAVEGFIRAFHGSPVPIVSAPSADKGVMKAQPSPIVKPVNAPASADSKLPKNLTHRLEQEIEALQKVHAQLQSVLAPMIAKNEVGMQSEPLTLTIALNDSVLFASGQAALTPQATTLLGKVGTSLIKLPLPFTITVRGYTDNQPIDTAQFSSNWALSATRAVTVTELFQQTGIDGAQLSAQGFGAFAPVADNATDAGRAQNRRVVIVIHAPDPSAQ